MDLLRNAAIRTKFMSLEAFKPSAIWANLKEKPKTRRKRIINNVLNVAMGLAIITFVDSVQTEIREEFNQFNRAADGISGPPFGENYQTCNAEETAQTESLKNLIEQKFGVSVINPDKVSSIKTYPNSPDDTKGVDIKTTAWDIESLRNLYRFLCGTPDSMYSVRKEIENYQEINFATNNEIQNYLKNGLPEDTYNFKFSFPDGNSFTFTREEMQHGLDNLRKGFNQIYSRYSLQSIGTQFVLVEESFKEGTKEGTILAAGEYRHASSYKAENDTIVIARSSKEEYYFLRVAIHELTHRVYANKEKEMDQELLQILGVKTKQNLRKGNLLCLIAQNLRLFI